MPMEVDKMVSADTIIDRQTKIAFLIMAHNNVTQLNLFLNQILEYEYAEVFIHVDAKGTSIIPHILKNSRIHILTEHINGSWGDYSLIDMTKKLLCTSKSYAEFDYYTLHSGADLAIKPVKDFALYLNQTHKYFYCFFNRLPAKNWGHGGGIERLVLRYPNWLRKRYQPYHPARYIRSMYQRLYEHGIIKGKKLPSAYSFYGGAQWFTISRQCLEDYESFMEQHLDYDAIFRTALIPDEIYFNSVFEMTRDGRDAETHNILMYIDWGRRAQKNHAGGPNICTMDYVEEIEKSGAFFARKFDKEIDSSIVDYFCNKTKALGTSPAL